MNLTTDEERWLASLKPFDRGNRLALLAILVNFREPVSYLDVGCGTGAMVRAARQLGIDAWGVDILPHPEGWLIQHDLREPLLLDKTFDLVTCIETAEHLPEESADTLCDTLVNHLAGDGVTSSGLLVFTGARVGQNGDGHVNCQAQEYWREKFEVRGLHYRIEATQQLAEAWKNTQMITHWLEENLQIFSR